MTSVGSEPSSDTRATAAPSVISPPGSRALLSSLTAVVRDVLSVRVSVRVSLSQPVRPPHQLSSRGSKLLEGGGGVNLMTVYSPGSWQSWPVTPAVLTDTLSREWTRPPTLETASRISSQYGLRTLDISSPLLNILIAGQESFLSRISAISNSVSISNIKSLHLALRHSCEGERVELHTRRGESPVNKGRLEISFSIARTSLQRSPAGTVMGSLSKILTYLSNLTSNLCQFSQGDFIDQMFFRLKNTFSGVFTILCTNSQKVSLKPQRISYQLVRLL